MYNQYWHCSFCTKFFVCWFAVLDLILIRTDFVVMVIFIALEVLYLLLILLGLFDMLLTYGITVVYTLSVELEMFMVHNVHSR